jgi:molybdopterin-containing oxidoreductase family iron-sulfur binding subunit
MNRRDFFKIVTTSGAAAAVGGCQQTAEHILAAVVPNPEMVPGVASYYATVCRECPAGCGVLARNRDGRVGEVGGQSEHPVNQGALCVRGQASLQGLYNPDRLAGPSGVTAAGSVRSRGTTRSKP